MKRVLIMLGNFLLVFAAVSCVMGALISAFSFTVDAQTLFWYWFIAAFVISVPSAIWRGKALIALMLPVVILILWNLHDILDGAKSVINFITDEYSIWLDIPVLFHGVRAYKSTQTAFFASAGVGLIFPLVISICLRRSALLTTIFTVPIVLLAFVLTTFQPNLWYVLGLLAVILTLMISGALHPDDFHKRGVAVFPALLLTIILLSAAYLLTMADSNRRGELIGFFDDRIRFIGVQAGFTRGSFGSGWPEMNSDIWQFDTDYVKISSAGQRTITDRSILEITASQAGTYYLKGYSLQQFDGRAWHDNSGAQRDYEDDFLRMVTSEIAVHCYINDLKSDNPDRVSSIVSMSVNKTGDNSDLAYLPYYSRSYSAPGFTPGINSSLSITDPALLTMLNPYTVDLIHIDGSLPELLAELPSGVVEELSDGSRTTLQMLSDRVYRSNTGVEDSTAAALRKIAFDEGIDPNAGRPDVADAVAAYISSAARYNLSPIPIPPGEDFALYFLQRTRQGYCIHFATAATLMLRSLGVPARFASGFVVTVPDDGAGKTIDVTDRHAHAWVEVFFDDIGWVPLEVTPSSPGSGVPARTPYVPSGESSSLEDYYEEDYYPGPRFGQGGGSTPSPSSDFPESDESQYTDQSHTRNMKILLTVTSCVIVFFLLLILRQYLARRDREKRFSQEDSNDAVINIWLYILRLRRKETQPVDADIEELALKARFSQHRMSAAERASMLSYALGLRSEVYKTRRLPGRLWLKYIRLF